MTNVFAFLEWMFAISTYFESGVCVTSAVHWRVIYNKGLLSILRGVCVTRTLKLTYLQEMVKQVCSLIDHFITRNACELYNMVWNACVCNTIKNSWRVCCSDSAIFDCWLVCLIGGKKTERRSRGGEWSNSAKHRKMLLSCKLYVMFVCYLNTYCYCWCSC